MTNGALVCFPGPKASSVTIRPFFWPASFQPRWLSDAPLIQAHPVTAQGTIFRQRQLGHRKTMRLRLAPLTAVMTTAVYLSTLSTEAEWERNPGRHPRVISHSVQATSFAFPCR